MNSRFVNCPAIRKSLEASLPTTYNVVNVWEGYVRNDCTITVYVEIADMDDNPPFMITEIALAELKAICGEMINVEIKGPKNLEFAFALPLTSKYIIRK